MPRWQVILLLALANPLQCDMVSRVRRDVMEPELPLTAAEATVAPVLNTTLGNYHCKSISTKLFGAEFSSVQYL